MSTPIPRKRGQKIAPSEIDKLVGMRIRIARNMSGKTQEHLADHLGITLQQAQKYENGKNKISVNVLLKVSQYFNIPVSYFVPQSVGNVTENMQNTMIAFEQNAHVANGQAAVAEDWKPIGYVAEPHRSISSQKKAVLEIVEKITLIKDPEKHQKILEYIKNLEKNG